MYYIQCYGRPIPIYQNIEIPYKKIQDNSNTDKNRRTQNS